MNCLIERFPNDDRAIEIERRVLVGEDRRGTVLSAQNIERPTAARRQTRSACSWRTGAYAGSGIQEPLPQPVGIQASRRPN